MKRRILIIGAFILFLLFLMLYLFNGVNFLDTFVYDLIINLKSDIFTNFMKFITFFASTKFITVIVIILFINNILKVIIKRERPTLINLVTETTYSFPSGHTMVAVVFYGFLIYLINKTKLEKIYKYIINSLLTILIILIMVSRIYLGAHYFSDVMAGACLATSYLILMIDILERRNIL